MFEKIVLVTRRTRLDELIERHSTRGQAKFAVESSGGDFAEYVKEDDAYRASVDRVRRSLELGLKLQVLERRLVPTYLFTEKDLVVAVGQDGLVANTAKYTLGLPLLGVNPDPERFDGVLLPFSPADAIAGVRAVIEGRARTRKVTLAQARLPDGQRLLAFNELFLGASSHVSARYRIKTKGKEEPQSSSGVIVSTGAGSTGWLSSVWNMFAGISQFHNVPTQLSQGKVASKRPELGWEDPRLIFVVREPFASRHSRASIVMGEVERGDLLELESLMPSGGVIFSDGVEQDFLAWGSGAVARVGVAPVYASLVLR